MKKMGRSQMLDKIHLYTVRTLIGITVLGCATLGSQIYNYYKYVRPVRLEEKRVMREEEIALEQSEKELELLRRQREAEEMTKY
ncbi:hypothetical protein EGW08_001929 [Elysia chlorotica]|uniref:Protein PET117 homolog, mitochondrial n=1 Tax=Elysia chlorotica TaxID=188477 RepID=A0A3S1CEA5_ELYCH|nr:hypothetical protein EGW08_001929 [Elysia chlorotica]